MRVARWSSLNRFASWSGSCSPVSSSSISLSWRSTRPCDRRERLTNMSLTLRRRPACSLASSTARWCSWSKVLATSPISSRESIPMGSTSSGAAGASGRCKRAIASGSRTSATSRAPACRRRSGPIIERAISSEVRNAMTRIGGDDDTGRDGLPLRVGPQLPGGADDLVQQAALDHAHGLQVRRGRRIPLLGVRGSRACEFWSAVTLSSSRLTASTAWPLTSTSYEVTWLGAASARNRCSAACRSAMTEENCCCWPNWNRPPDRTRCRSGRAGDRAVGGDAVEQRPLLGQRLLEVAERGEAGRPAGSARCCRCPGRSAG